jgi:hypothetical protein
LKFGGSLRHHGHLFVVLLAAWWIARQGARPPGRYAEMCLTALLALHAAVGIYYWTSDVRQPYSPSREAATFLRDRYGAGGFDLVANPGNYASPVAAYLDVPVYFPARHAWGSFEMLDGTPKRAAPAELARALDELCAASTRPVVLLSSEPVEDPGVKLRLSRVASFRRSLTDEGYELYEVWVRPGGAPSTRRLQ